MPPVDIPALRKLMNGFPPLPWTSKAMFCLDAEGKAVCAAGDGCAEIVAAINALPALLDELEALRERLKEEIRWGHIHCTESNCVSSGVDCPMSAVRSKS